MTAYSVADAKNNLPRLIDRALAGDEVVITRHGRPVAELRARPQEQKLAAPATYDWLKAQRDARPAPQPGARRDAGA